MKSKEYLSLAGLCLVASSLSGCLPGGTSVSDSQTGAGLNGYVPSSVYVPPVSTGASCYFTGSGYTCSETITGLGQCSSGALGGIHGNHNNFDINTVGGSFCSSFFSNVQMKNSSLSGGQFMSAVLDGVDFTNSNLTAADFSYAVLVSVDFDGAKLSGATFDQVTVDLNTTMRSNYATGVTITNSVLSGFRVYDANFTGSNLSSNTFKTNEMGTRINFSGANLSGANLSQSRFLGTGKTKMASMTNANFSGANLEGVEFSFINMDNANFYGADLRNVKFRSSSSPGSIGGWAAPTVENTSHGFGVSFKNAKICGADLRQLDIDVNTDFDGAVRSGGTKLPSDLTPSQLNEMKDATNTSSCTAP